MTSPEQTIDDVLPDPGFDIEPRITALGVTDPQHDFLSADGVAWELVGRSVTANDTVAHLEALLRAARDSGIPVFISPHYYCPNDHKWHCQISDHRGPEPRGPQGWWPTYAAARASAISERQRVRKSRRCSASETWPSPRRRTRKYCRSSSNAVQNRDADSKLPKPSIG